MLLAWSDSQVIGLMAVFRAWTSFEAAMLLRELDILRLIT